MSVKLHVVHVPKIAIARGDVIVLECPNAVPPGDQLVLRRALKQLWPRHQCLILTDGVKLKIGTASK